MYSNVNLLFCFIEDSTFWMNKYPRILLDTFNQLQIYTWISWLNLYTLLRTKLRAKGSLVKAKLGRYMYARELVWFTLNYYTRWVAPKFRINISVLVLNWYPLKHLHEMMSSCHTLNNKQVCHRKTYQGIGI